MKTLDKLGLLVIALWMGDIVLTPSITQFLLGDRFGDPTFVTTIASWSIAATSILRFAVQIGIAVWIYIETKKDNNLPWFWLSIVLVFGIEGAIFYYLVKIYEQYRAHRTGEVTANKAL
nr:cardiolipin synthetase [uncultured bacterium]